jgi:hypothetical protein
MPAADTSVLEQHSEQKAITKAIFQAQKLKISDNESRSSCSSSLQEAFQG